jgi:PAS domain S-box-containing protein
VPTETDLRARIAELEHELRSEREERETVAMILDLALQQMPGTYYIVDRDLTIVRTGGAIERVLGYPLDHYIGQSLHEAMARDPSSGDAIAAHRRAIDGESKRSEIEYRGKCLALTLGPYRNAAGEIIGAIGTSIDVTAWRMLERRMVDAQRAESLGVLAGGLAHDFNNLLVAVLGNADLALREIEDGKSGHTAIVNIQTAGLRAAELTEQLLAYAGRGGAGNKRVEPILVVEELLCILAPSVPKDIKISVDIPTKLAVRGDPAQFRQVLLNLIVNARDALTGGSGTIIVRGDAQTLTGAPHPHDVLTAAAGSYVVIDVEDDGPGMDADVRRHVFEPFFTTKQRGHGLGLAAVVGIVRAHGGGIRLCSSPGAGARFQVMWPTASPGSAAHAATPQPKPGRTVLVIDDEDIVRDVLARMVEDLGYSAVTAADGASGLALVERQAIDAVLLDLTMPRMNGSDVIVALRERCPSLPVVVCSGYDREGRGPIQADAYLPKPFGIDALERTLAKLLPLQNV